MVTKKMKYDEKNDVLVNAIVAFNKAGSWDEFIVNLDLLCTSVEEVEKMYFEWLDLNMHLKNTLVHVCGGYKNFQNHHSIDLHCLFNCSLRDFNFEYDFCLALPCKIKKYIEQCTFTSNCKVFYTKNAYVNLNFSKYLVEDIESMYRIDVISRLWDTILYNISMENRNERKKHNAVWQACQSSNHSQDCE